jgi:hypothetical protein
VTRDCFTIYDLRKNLIKSNNILPDTIFADIAFGVQIFHQIANVSNINAREILADVPE